MLLGSRILIYHQANISPSWHCLMAGALPIIQVYHPPMPGWPCSNGLCFPVFLRHAAVRLRCGPSPTLNTQPSSLLFPRHLQELLIRILSCLLLPQPRCSLLSSTQRFFFTHAVQASSQHRRASGSVIASRIAHSFLELKCSCSTHLRCSPVSSKLPTPRVFSSLLSVSPPGQVLRNISSWLLESDVKWLCTISCTQPRKTFSTILKAHAFSSTFSFMIDVLCSIFSSFLENETGFAALSAVGSHSSSTEHSAIFSALRVTYKVTHRLSVPHQTLLATFPHRKIDFHGPQIVSVLACF